VYHFVHDDLFGCMALEVWYCMVAVHSWQSADYQQDWADPTAVASDLKMKLDLSGLCDSKAKIL